MYILLSLFTILCTAVCMTSLVFNGDDMTGQITPFFMKGNWRYYIAAGAFIGNIFTMIIMFDKQYEKVDKPKYIMIEQEQLYKRVFNE